MLNNVNPHGIGWGRRSILLYFHMQKLEENSIKQFDFWAKFHQIFSIPFYFLSKEIVKIVNPTKGTSVLDIGCGWGLLLKELHKMDRELKLYGIDISPKMVHIAKLRLKNTDGEILEGSADNLPYKDNSFKYVTCILSFHHHPDSLKSLREMYRVLKPGGKVFLLDPFKSDFVSKFMVIVNNIVFQEKDIHVYTNEGMKKIFEEAGFVNIQQKVRNAYHLLTIGEKV